MNNCIYIYMYVYIEIHTHTHLVPSAVPVACLEKTAILSDIAGCSSYEHINRQARELYDPIRRKPSAAAVVVLSGHPRLRQGQLTFGIFRLADKNLRERVGGGGLPTSRRL